MATTVMWFRRDLRLADNPALRHAVDAARTRRRRGRGVVPLYVVDPTLWAAAGPSRRAYLVASLADLGARVGGWQLRRGDPVDEVVAVARAAGAARRCTWRPTSDRTGGHAGRAGRAGAGRSTASSWCGPARRTRSRPVASPSGTARRTRSTRRSAGRGPTTAGAQPVGAPRGVDWVRPMARGRPARRRARRRAPRCPPRARRRRGAGGAGSSRRPSTGYASDRDRPDLDRTSRMSVHLKWGEIHPRTMLADLAAASGRAGDSVADATARSWPGGSSTPTCCTTTRQRPRLPAPALVRTMAYDRPGAAARGLAPRGAPASRSSTPGCVSCGARGGCTTGSG